MNRELTNLSVEDSARQLAAQQGPDPMGVVPVETDDSAELTWHRETKMGGWTWPLFVRRVEIWWFQRPWRRELKRYERLRRQRQKLIR